MTTVEPGSAIEESYPCGSCICCWEPECGNRECNTEHCACWAG